MDKIILKNKVTRLVENLLREGKYEITNEKGNFLITGDSIHGSKNVTLLLTTKDIMSILTGKTPNSKYIKNVEDEGNSVIINFDSVHGSKNLNFIFKKQELKDIVNG